MRPFPVLRMGPQASGCQPRGRRPGPRARRPHPTVDRDAGNPLVPHCHEGVRRHGGPGHLVLPARCRRHRCPVGAQASRKVDRQISRNRLVKAQSKDRLAALAKLTHQRSTDPSLRREPAADGPGRIHLHRHLLRIDTGEPPRRVGRVPPHPPGDRQRLLEKHQFVDLARKVVGVGSVGTRCWVALFVGRDNFRSPVPQIKEAEAAVGEPFLGPSEYSHPRPAGGRGPAPHAGKPATSSSGGQLPGRRRRHPRLLSAPACGTGRPRPTWKQHDPEALEIYAQMCGWTLARAHARSGESHRHGVLPRRRYPSSTSDLRLRRLPIAEPEPADFEALTAAIAADRIHAVRGV